MTITYEVYQDPEYAGFVLRVDLPAGPVYGRTAFDPSAERPGTGDGNDWLPLPVLGLDGNFYALQASKTGDAYSSVYAVSLVRWPTRWDGAEPQGPASVAQAEIGGAAATYYDPAIGYLLPAGDSVQGFFCPHSTGTHYALSLVPGESPVIHVGSGLPRTEGSSMEFSDAIAVGRSPDGLRTFAVGANFI